MHCTRLLIPIVLLIVMVALFGSVAISQEIDYTRIDPTVELRGIWIDAGAIPKTVRGVRELVRSYRRTNLNVLFPEVICRGYAVYPSRLLARDPQFAGAIDPLPVMIREAHRLGMEVHPWVWVFRGGYSNDCGAILTAHPEWAELGKDGKDLSPNGGLWISPAIREARDFVADLLAELVTCYDVDGLHLDYVRYEVEDAVPYGYCGSSRAEFTRQYGIDPAGMDDSATDRYLWQKFRERQINTFMQRIALQTRSIRPRVKISAAVGPIPDEARSKLLQNWVNWVDNKWVDFVVPMAYSTDDPHFGRMIKRELEAVACRTILAPGIGLFQFRDAQQLARQIGIARETGAAGQALFSAYYFNQGHATALTDGPYRRPSLLPIREPWEKSRLLCEQAACLANQGRQDEAKWLDDQANALADYAKYQEAQIGYVPPTPPPGALHE